MSRRLLLVDDEDDIRTIATISLGRLGGWAVVPVGSGAAALAAVEDAGEPFDAIVLDVMMPGEDGPATLLRLRASESAAHVPVVFLTAKVQASDRERLLALGASGVLAKPFDPMRLHLDLDRILGNG